MLLFVRFILLANLGFVGVSWAVEHGWRLHGQPIDVGLMKADGAAYSASRTKALPRTTVIDGGQCLIIDVKAYAELGRKFFGVSPRLR